MLLSAVNASVRLRHNTIVLGPDASKSFGVIVTGEAPVVAPALRFENNLLVGSDKTARVGFAFEACPELLLGTFAGNGLANLDGAAVQVPDGAACKSAAVPDNLETFQPGLAALCASKQCAGSVLENVHLRDTCSMKGVCAILPACFTQNDCATALFEQWSPDAGATTLAGSDRGWRLKPTLSCPSQQTSYAASLATDRYGAGRTKDYSRGAHEQEACVVPPK